MREWDGGEDGSYHKGSHLLLHGSMPRVALVGGAARCVTSSVGVAGQGHGNEPVCPATQTAPRAGLEQIAPGKCARNAMGVGCRGV